jgi:hypothetical protein
LQSWVAGYRPTGLFVNGSLAAREGSDRCVGRCRGGRVETADEGADDGGEPAEALLAGEVPGDVVQDPLRSKRLAVDRVDDRLMPRDTVSWWQPPFPVT